MKIFTIVTHKHYAKAVFDVCNEIQNSITDKLVIYNYNYDKQYPHKIDRTYSGLNIVEITVPFIQKYYRPIGGSNQESITLEEFIESVEQDILREKPNALLLIDDGGIIEYNIVRTFYLHNIPIILWAHGSGSNMPLEYSYKHPYERLEVINYGKNAVKNISSVFNPIGRNQYYSICVNSINDKIKLLNSGVPSYCIEITGNPTNSEKIIRWKNTNKKLIKKDTLSILIVSSGLSIWNEVNFDLYNNIFYENIFQVVQSCGDNFTFYLRMKPGEITTKWGNHLQEQLKNLPIKIVDNDKPFIDIVEDYDIVLGSESTCLIDAAFCHTPVVRVRHHPYLEIRSMPFRLPFLSINNFQESESILKVAYSDKYVQVQNNALYKHEHELFYSFDGKAHIRIAHHILKRISKDVNSAQIRYFSIDDYSDGMKYTASLNLKDDYILKKYNVSITTCLKYSFEILKCNTLEKIKNIAIITIKRCFPVAVEPLKRLKNKF